jgi:hypothetical protein
LERSVRFDFRVLQHVDVRSVGNVAVCPRRVFAGGCARWIEQAWLREQDKRFSACCPARVAPSAAAISSNVPPR